VVLVPPVGLEGILGVEELHLARHDLIDLSVVLLLLQLGLAKAFEDVVIAGVVARVEALVVDVHWLILVLEVPPVDRGLGLFSVPVILYFSLDVDHGLGVLGPGVVRFAVLLRMGEILRPGLGVMGAGVALGGVLERPGVVGLQVALDVIGAADVGAALDGADIVAVLA
jgi:hypothetical protein